MEQPARSNRDLIQALEAMGNKLRIHSIVATSEAGSGHPTSCMSAADLTAAVFFYAMRYEVPNPKNPVNDRFVLSKGHAAPLLYAAWAEAGAFPVERLKTLREFTSDLEGHPTPRVPWVEVATGSLGQGLSVAAGMALASRIRGVPYRVNVVLGDGELNEGQVWEAAMFAGSRALSNLCCILDLNWMQVEGHCDSVLRLDPIADKWRAFNWQVIEVDGHDLDVLLAAFAQARAHTTQPTMIVATTVPGKGVSALEGVISHNAKLPHDVAVAALAELGETV